MSKLPLPPQFFRCPVLTDADTADLKAFAEQASIDAICHARLENGPIAWSLVEDDHDLQVLCGQDRTAPAGVLTYCSVTDIFASIDDVAGIFRAETAKEYQAYRRNFATDLLDGAPLYTLTSPTVDNPRQFVGVKWMAMSSPTPTVIKPRDFCAIECRYDFDTQGKRGFVRCLKSVTLACCPDLEASHGLVRGEYHRLAYVFIESDRPGYLHATQLMQVNFHGMIPSWLARLGAKKRARTLGDMELYLRGKRLTESAFLNDQDLVDKSNRSRCFVCQRSFGPFGTKCSCRKCGEVVCKACSRSWHVNADGVPRQVRVCTSCTTTGHATSGSDRIKSLTLPVTPSSTSREFAKRPTTPSAASSSGHVRGATPRLARATSAKHTSMETSTTSTSAAQSPPSFDFLNESIFQVDKRDTGVDGRFHAAPLHHRMQHKFAPGPDDPVRSTWNADPTHDGSRGYLQPRGQHTGGLQPRRLANGAPTPPMLQTPPPSHRNAPRVMLLPTPYDKHAAAPSPQRSARNDIIPLVMSP